MQNPLRVFDMKRFLKRVNGFQIIIESLLIIFSILFALGVNEIRATKQLNSQKEESLHNLENELKQNFKGLEKVIPYHKKITQRLLKIIDSLSTIKGEINKTGLELMSDVNPSGIMPPSPQKTSWETIRITNSISLLDFELVNDLSKLYKLQEDGVEITWKLIANFLLSRENFDPNYTLENLKILNAYITELYSQELYLKQKIKYVLAKHFENKNK